LRASRVGTDGQHPLPASAVSRRVGDAGLRPGCPARARRPRSRAAGAARKLALP